MVFAPDILKLLPETFATNTGTAAGGSGARWGGTAGKIARGPTTRHMPGRSGSNRGGGPYLQIAAKQIARVFFWVGAFLPSKWVVYERDDK